METPDFQIVEDVNLTLRAELDQRTISFPELLGLEVDSILNLRRPTGENVDLYAGKVLIGHGEILVIEQSLAVRVAELRARSTQEDEEDETEGTIGPLEGKNR
ncbi:MAG TPA: FliM/FliN family flagellar motor switch protein [Bryobacteraceae bacterium]|jgi:flagellar motor switch protein FliN/FliY